jgi:biopolymer transport protein ExbD
MLDVGSELANGDSAINLNITPLIDVVFLLLIFFLLASAFARPTFDVELPSAAHSRLESEPKRQILVFLTRDGRVLVDEVPVPLPELQSHLEQALAADRDRPVVLQADKDSSFGGFIAIMDAAKGARAAQLIIETVRTPEESSHGP